MQVTIIGLGYVGLPLAAVLATRGFRVRGVDTDAGVVRRINECATRCTEPHLDGLLRAVVADGLLAASQTVEPSDLYVIAVPTPLDAQRAADLTAIRQACSALAPVLKPGDVVILESTSPVGTTEQLACWLAQGRTDLSFPHAQGDAADVRIAYCPERVLPGNALAELISNDRVIGGLTTHCASAAAAFYRSFITGECVTTDSRTAEACKLAENSFRDLNLAFANELSMICDRLGVDTPELIRLANRHPRVSILQPGAGVGGHCIAVDPWFLVQAAPDLAQLTRQARQVNDAKPAWVIDRVEAAVAQLALAGLAAPTIACLGLAFKAGSDDLRESPALAIALALARRFVGRVRAVEPHLQALPSSIAAELPLVDLAMAGACDLLVLLVPHRQFFEASLPLRVGQRVVDVCGSAGCHPSNAALAGNAHEN
nr:UDP-N-acetyl-D-mannosamine dehydrogenase [Pseudomonas sp. RIT-PI-S]